MTFPTSTELTDNFIATYGAGQPGFEGDLAELIAARAAAARADAAHPEGSGE